MAEYTVTIGGWRFTAERRVESVRREGRPGKESRARGAYCGGGDLPARCETAQKEVRRLLETNLITKTGGIGPF